MQDMGQQTANKCQRHHTSKTAKPDRTAPSSRSSLLFARYSIDTVQCFGYVRRLEVQNSRNSIFVATKMNSMSTLHTPPPKPSFASRSNIITQLSSTRTTSSIIVISFPNLLTFRVEPKSIRFCFNRRSIAIA